MIRVQRIPKRWVDITVKGFSYFFSRKLKKGYRICSRKCEQSTIPAIRCTALLVLHNSIKNPERQAPQFSSTYRTSQRNNHPWRSPQRHRGTRIKTRPLRLSRSKRQHQLLGTMCPHRLFYAAPALRRRPTPAAITARRRTALPRPPPDAGPAGRFGPFRGSTSRRAPEGRGDPSPAVPTPRPPAPPARPPAISAARGLARRREAGSGGAVSSAQARRAAASGPR
jgi:hypothetical protein